MNVTCIIKNAFSKLILFSSQKHTRAAGKEKCCVSQWILLWDSPVLTVRQR